MTMYSRYQFVQKFPLPESIIPSANYQGVVKEIKDALRENKIELQVDTESIVGIPFTLPSNYEVSLYTGPEWCPYQFMQDRHADERKLYIDESNGEHTLLKQIDPKSLHLYSIHLRKNVESFKVGKFNSILELLKKDGYYGDDKRAQGYPEFNHLLGSGDGYHFLIPSTDGKVENQEIENARIHMIRSTKKDWSTSRFEMNCGGDPEIFYRLTVRFKPHIRDLTLLDKVCSVTQV